MADIRETSIDCLSEDQHANFYSSERKWINKILKLKEARPDEVQIVNFNDEEGYINARVPKSWMVVRPPKVINLTEEQKQARAEAMRLARESKK